jgi:methyl-accepting chemotaxis protein
LKVKIEVEDLMTLNQESMYEEASALKQQSHRALMPGIIAIVSALVFLILFNFFIRRIFVRPIQKITESVKNFHPNSEGLKSDITYHDEFEVLENEIQLLIQRLRTKNEN